MKKSIYIIVALVLVLSLGTYLWMNRPLDTEQIKSISLTNGKSHFNINKEQYTLFVDLINSLESQTIIEETYFDGLSVDVETRGRGRLDFNVSPNYKDQTLIVSHKNITYELYLEEPGLQTLLSLEPFHQTYALYQPPSLHLTSPSGDKVMTTRGEWGYYDLVGNLHAYQGAIATTDYVTTFNLKEGQTLSLDSSYQNYDLTVRYGENFDQVVGPSGKNIELMSIHGTTAYLVEVTYYDDQMRALGSYQFEFDVDMVLPPQVTSSSLDKVQGDVVRFEVKYLPEGASVFLNQSIKEGLQGIWQEDKVLISLPLNYHVASGDYDLQVVYTDNEDLVEVFSGVLRVNDRAFDMQNLVISKQVDQDTRNDQARVEYNTYFVPVFNESSDRQLWQGQFILPLEGRLTTDYGTRRTVNGSLSSYRHSGLDLAADENTPVMASNTGQVVFSRHLIWTGHTIVIDHGLGYFTVYKHLNTRQVAQGDLVTKGQVIGKVGSTGFSSGPHLHFDTSWHYTFLDPYKTLEWDGLWP